MSRKDTKRLRDLNSSGEEDTKIFERSKRTARSPPQYNTVVEKHITEENMEEMKQMMKQMMEMIKTNTEENKSLREEMRRKEEKWESEKLQLEKRIETLENRLEEQEKERRRCNIVIKGMTERQTYNQQEIKEWFKNNIKVDVEVKNVTKLNQPGKRSMLLVKLENFHEKQEIMKNKNKLKETDIYIENDLTLDERKIAANIRQIAKEQRRKGKQVKIGYKKMYIDKKLYTWNIRLETLIEQDTTKN